MPDSSTDEVDAAEVKMRNKKLKPRKTASKAAEPTSTCQVSEMKSRIVCSLNALI